jgi:FkbM family methyltransferase
MIIKDWIRSTLNFLHLDLTKNLEYDRLTAKIIKAVVDDSSNCVDVGCHKGEILDLILKSAPNGQHFGFEPIPVLYNSLKAKYDTKAKIFPYALSSEDGLAKFNYVKNDPAYSGLQKRNYDRNNPIIEQIEVEVKRLDDLINSTTPIRLIKIDVEGGEFGVLKGAKQILLRDKPIIIFESGKGASDFYGTTPEEFYRFLNSEIGFQVYTLKAFLDKSRSLDQKQFVDYFNTNEEYYFVGQVL